MQALLLKQITSSASRTAQTMLAYFYAYSRTGEMHVDAEIQLMKALLQSKRQRKISVWKCLFDFYAKNRGVLSRPTLVHAHKLLR